MQVVTTQLELDELLRSLSDHIDPGSTAYRSLILRPQEWIDVRRAATARLTIPGDPWLPSATPDDGVPGLEETRTVPLFISLDLEGELELISRIRQDWDHARRAFKAPLRSSES